MDNRGEFAARTIYEEEGSTMRTAYDAWRDNERYEDMSEFDKFLVDEYEAERLEEKADQYDREEEEE
jgi:hypothetical protein